MLQIKYGTTTEIEYDGIVFHIHSPDFDILHSHNCYEFTAIIKGSYENIVNGEKQILRAGSIILLCPNDCHRIKIIDKDSLHMNLLIEKEKFENVCNSISPDIIDFINNNCPFKEDSNNQFISKMESYLSTIKITDEATTKTLSTLIIFNIIDFFMNNNLFSSLINYPENFKNILLECNLEKNISWKVSDVAEFSHYTKTHVNRMFKKYLSMSASDYLTKIKMNAAKVLVLTSNNSIAKISNILGYSSLSYFNKIFTKNFGLTPYQYKLDYLRKRDTKK